MMKDCYGQVTFEAILSNEVKERQKELLQGYAEAYRGYKAARKENPSESKPTRPAMKVLQSRICGDGAKEKAESIAAKWQDKYDEKMAKKRGDKPDKPADPEPTEQKG